jgi:GTPase SAR1 family protein
MQKIKIDYNPYTMRTIMMVNGVDVCKVKDYGQFKDFIDTHTPLQTWIEPVAYKNNWKGIVNELKSDEEGYDILEFHFHGREIDFEDLKKTCETENEKRKYKLDLKFVHDTVISDEDLTQRVDKVMNSLLSNRFAKFVEEQGKESEAYSEYQKLGDNYNKAKQKEFKIVFAGLYSSGKSTILNSLIRHNVLPTSDETCTAKTCKIRHDGGLKNKITLQCFDKEGKVVVKKETFENDVDCLNRFWKITPIGAKKSVPETVDVVELCMDLSHLYPSPKMAEAFNLVLIDTPGSNSSKNAGDMKIALDAITNGDREMVVICASATNYEDNSIGVFLKAIHEAFEEDKGNFNDRFLFVLNRCDELQFNDKDKTIKEKKSNFAGYLMDTKRWGISETSLKFVPRIFMISAYNYFALQQGVFKFTEDEIKGSKEKQNLVTKYKEFHQRVIDWEDKNYFLSQVCDVPDYMKEQYKKEFEESLADNQEYALEIQTGMSCLEGAVKDYIERYAYPLKVRSLIETFDLLLESVKEFKDEQAKILKEYLDEIKKGEDARGEAEKQKEEEEKKETNLQGIKATVEEEKSKIAKIDIKTKFQKTRKKVDKQIEKNKYIKKARNAHGYKKLDDNEILNLTNNVSLVFEDAWGEVDRAFSEMSKEYKQKTEDICKVLNETADKLLEFDINGYNFSYALALKKIKLRDAESLAKDIQKTKQHREYTHDVQYEWWQIISKIRKFFNPNLGKKTDKWDEYSLESLKDYVTEVSDEFVHCTSEAEKSYIENIDGMKKNASKMADDIIRDIETIAKNIDEYKKNIASLGNNIEELNCKIKEQNETIEWLNQLVDDISEGGVTGE